MSTPTVAWSETSPAGSDARSQGDDRIREMKTQIREVIGVDHDFPSSGQAADVGQHLQVTLQEQADLGTGAANATILGSQTVGGKGELVYTDEDDNDIQLTNAGLLNVPISTYTEKESVVGADSLLISDSAASEAAKKLLVSTLLGTIYPVGSIYTNAAVSTNPGTLLGFGTWTAFGAGKVMVGLDSGDADFDTVEETGGAKTVSIAHTHTVPYTGYGIAGSYSAGGTIGVAQDGGSYANLSPNSGAMSANATPSVVQPYIVVYMWKRTA